MGYWIAVATPLLIAGAVAFTGYGLGLYALSLYHKRHKGGA